MPKNCFQHLPGLSVGLFLVLTTSFQSGYSEPLLLEQAPNVAEKAQVEIGLKSAYGLDEFTLTGVAGTNFTFAAWQSALFLRYGLSSRLELLADVPHLSLRTEQESSAGASSTSESGLGDIKAGLKVNFFPPHPRSAPPSPTEGRGKNNRNDEKGSGRTAYGALVLFDIPTGDADKGLGQGFDLHPQALLSRHRERLLLDFNAGYKLTGDYTAGGTKVEPGDSLTYGLSAGYQSAPWALLVEGQGEHFGKEKQAGVEVANSDGSRFEVTPGLRWQRKNLKLKSGVSVSLGEEAQRVYDWRAFVGVSVVGRFSLSMN